MNALIFAAGLGTRLKPFTDSHPKALVPVQGEAMLGRVLRRIRQCPLPIHRIVVNIHHFPDQIRQFLDSPQAQGNPAVEISDESARLLDTGGGAAQAVLLLGGPGEPLLIHNADILTDFPLEEMLSAHLSSEADVTLLVSAQRASTRHFLFDESGKLAGWENTSTGETRPASLIAGEKKLTACAFGGVHIIGPRAQKALLDEAPEGTPFSITDFYIRHCGELDIRAFSPAATYQWFDIGTPEKLRLAESNFTENK